MRSALVVLIFLSLPLLSTCSVGNGSDSSRYNLVTAEEMWCDNKITQINNTRATVVKHYDSGNSAQLKASLETMIEQCQQLRNANMLGESCAFHMFGGGRPTSPERYRTMSTICVEANELYKPFQPQ